MEAYISTVDEIITGGVVIDTIYDSLRFVMDDAFSKTLLYEKLKNNLQTLRRDLKVIIETEYVDKVYRDCFYRFFSTKMKGYNRNCIRLSFFEPEFNSIEDFISSDVAILRQWYDGFLVIRPIANCCIGRNALSKRAKISQNYEICHSSIKSTCMGAKLTVDAFPHSSQDGEYMTCAETTIWTMLEYFGNKYTLYNPALPTEIVDSLESSAFERITPSTGLNFQQLSMALKKHGLSTKVYSKYNYNANPEKFQELFNCYIESGFPIAVCLTNPNGGGHAVVCVGRNHIAPASFTTSRQIFAGGNSYIFWNSHKSNIILVDDNFPSYQSTPFTNPTSYYTDPSFCNLYISHFIVPLHSKIYLPAEIAIDASNYLVNKVIKAPDGSCIKTFLTSNRSYREYVLTNPDYTPVQKQALLQIEMPKFVWVTEIATQAQMSAGRANSVILLDATGNKSSYTDLSQLIFLQFAGNGYIFNVSTRKFENFSLPLQPEFMAFKGNLK